MSKIELEKDIDLNEVLEFAKEKHKGQKRDSGEDYIVHPIRVAKLVDTYKAQFSKNREVLIAAARLHDTLEDTYTSYRELTERFGIVVASLVQELTTAKYASKMKSKAKYLAEKMTNMTSYALLIKLADRYDNICDLSGTSIDKRTRTINDTKYIIDYLIKNRELTSSHKLFIKLLQEKISEYDENQQFDR